MTPPTGSLVRGTTRVVGVFGWPVAHSASPPMHNAAFAALGMDWVYVPFPVAPEHIGAALAGVRVMGVAGVNVTVPLKELVAPHLDGMSDRARRLGSVNTVVHQDGQLWGDSTDGPGLLAALASAGETVGPQSRVVVLGAGGSARAVVYALAETGATVWVANRNAERADALAASLAPHVTGAIIPLPLTEAALRDVLPLADVLINTTSAGMHPNETEMPPVPADVLRPGLLVSDLIYNPWETRLLALAKQKGCRDQNGAEMLVQQGAMAFFHWTQTQPPLDVMRNAVFQNAVRGTIKP